MNFVNLNNKHMASYSFRDGVTAPQNPIELESLESNDLREEVKNQTPVLGGDQPEEAKEEADRQPKG